MSIQEKNSITSLNSIYNIFQMKVKQTDVK